MEFTHDYIIGTFDANAKIYYNTSQARLIFRVRHPSKEVLDTLADMFYTGTVKQTPQCWVWQTANQTEIAAILKYWAPFSERKDIYERWGK